MAKLKKKKQKPSTGLIYLYAIAAVLSLVVAIGLLFQTFGWKDKTPNPDDKPPNEVAIPVGIPTIEQLSKAMSTAVEDIYGDDYYTIMNEGVGDTIRIPNTAITFGRIDVGDALDMMAVTAAVFKRNPYAINIEHPDEWQNIVGNYGNPIKEMPDGSKIDLSKLVENYSDIKIFVSRDVPTEYTIEGYVNGEYFKESISLLSTYKAYKN